MSSFPLLTEQDFHIGLLKENILICIMVSYKGVFNQNFKVKFKNQIQNNSKKCNRNLNGIISNCFKRQKQQKGIHENREK